MKKSITTIAIAVIIVAIILSLVGCSGSAGSKTTKTSSPTITGVKTNTIPGNPWAWGSNTSGVLGNGTMTDTATPVQLSNLTAVITVAAGQNSSMALKSDGTVWAWGNNGLGELGNGNNTGSNVPVQVSSLTGITAISVGQTHAMALCKQALPHLINRRFS